ncbi:MAG: diadenylate cyclase CdaA [Bacteriovoracaceae bacterium]|nr:diadenylate cyclase CdaA [Bacteroidota bacterium]
MELIKFSFLTVTVVDVIDILLVSFIFYQLYRGMRGTIAAQILIGLVVIVVLSVFAQSVNLKAMGWILRTLTDIWVIAFIIIFQPEIRRLLSTIARNRLVRLFIRLNVTESIEEISATALELSKKKQGALIIIARGTGMKSFTETGIPLGAQISRLLLLSIFNPRSPLHDGAVIVNDRIIEAARCTLPLSSITRIGDLALGTRHRAGLGVTEQTDAVAVIISEETGAISIADNGELFYKISVKDLRKELRERLVLSVQRTMQNVKEAIRPQ